MPSGGFEFWIPANDRLQTYALNRTTTGIGFSYLWFYQNIQY